MHWMAIYRRRAKGVNVPKVIIDGQLYLPSTELGIEIREAVSRAVANLFMGEYGEDWEERFNEDVADMPIRLYEEECSKYDVSAEEFVDDILNRLIMQGQKLPKKIKE